MNVQDYKTAGFNLSMLIDQAVITRAEKDVIAAYITPLLGHAPTQEEMASDGVKNALMCLSFLLVQQRSSAATRAGAKTKLTEQSNTPTADELLRQHAPSCVAALRALNEDAHKKVRDICKVFFTTNYFYTN